MEAASQLFCCGIEPLRGNSPAPRFLLPTTGRSLHRRRAIPVLAVATDPKPPSKTLDGSSASPPLKPVNGVST
ncbi:hypothetical protein CRG98_039266, partial [Punica granatum]